MSGCQTGKRARGLIIGAPRSGAGKTSVTIGLLRALKRRAVQVRGAKSGPDYIDPEFHQAATGEAGVNLDSWAMSPALLAALLGQAASGADMVLIESAMGLFDGVEAGAGRSGAASDLARRFRIPVLLVVDVSGQSRSAAAIAHGFNTFDPEVTLAGVVLNQVASDRHFAQAAGAVEKAGIRVFGGIRRNREMVMPERHLGLVQAGEHGDLEAFIEQMADVMERWIDIDVLLDAVPAIDLGASPAGKEVIAIAPPGQRIALARDRAFSFVYPHLLRQWRAAGAEIVPFSPLADESPPADCDCCWLPGGYPELYGGALAAARDFRQGLADFAAQKPVHGECGGFMVLGRALEDAEGVGHEMCALLDHVTSFARRKMNLGYRRALLQADCAIGRQGQAVRGHEFHYARVIEPGTDAPLVHLADALGNDLGLAGARRERVSGTFFHAIAGDD
ncbi:MAG TPA: cobyrinate a,c-diamide synthase [Rhodobacteraceae bacterium]|nr:cobyrinate a,c-diamide synthase [Paracoccaceae bacterium]